MEQWYENGPKIQDMGLFYDNTSLNSAGSMSPLDYSDGDDFKTIHADFIDCLRRKLTEETEDTVIIRNNRIQNESRKQFFTENPNCINKLFSKELLLDEIKRLYNEYREKIGDRVEDIFIPRHCGRHVDFMRPWYLEKPELLKQEVLLMERNWSDFKLKKTILGDYCWVGTVKPVIVRQNAEYSLRVKYNQFTDKAPFFSIVFDIISADVEISRDALWLNCPINEITEPYSNCASTCIAKAIKWLNVYELFLAGYLNEEEFEFIASVW